MTLVGVSALTAVAVPVLRAQLAVITINGAAKQVAGDLHRARMRAVAENARYRVVYASTQYQIEKDVAGVFVPQGGAVSLPDGVAAAVKPEPVVTFRPSGWVDTDATMVIMLANGESDTREITVTFGGRIAVAGGGA